MLTIGETFLHYDIISVLGEGGMGEVYLAKDRHLDRKLAIKLLRKKFNDNEQGLRRFILEAKTASALNHPNIITIYEIGQSDGSHYIATEYVVGHTLHELLAANSLDIDEILYISIQAAEALAAAHSAGIIHRDIKPENIMVRGDGYVKVLDFGLAKLLDREDIPADTNAATQKIFETNPGVIMGTVSYMSPEQARGIAVDTRTDIWSLGVVLFQMLTGRLPFAGETASDVIASLLRSRAPKLTKYAPDSPKELEHIIDKALRKDPEERYQHIKDMLIDLKDVRQELTLAASNNGYANRRKTSVMDLPESTEGEQTAHSTVEPAPARTHSISEMFISQFRIHPRIMAAALAIVFFAAAAGAIGLTRWISGFEGPHSFDSLRPVKLVSWKSEGGSGYADYAASHNGKIIAFSSTQDSPNEGIYVKQTADSSAVRITTDNWRNYGPIWSPDDQSIAYLSFRDGKYGIYKVGFLGGDPLLLAAAPEGSLSLRHWSNDGSTIFYEFNGNLFQVNLASRETKQITDFEPSRIVRRDYALSPDESKIAFSDRRGNQSDLWVLSRDGGQPVQLTDDADDESQPTWLPDNRRILYSVLRDGHFHINIAYLNGRLPEQITRGDSEYRLIGVSKDGSRIFYSAWEDRSDVWSVNVQSGQESVVANTAEAEFWSDISPDGKSILFQTNAVPNPASGFEDSSIAIRSVKDENPLRVIKGYDPRWMPDGRHIAFLRWEGPENRNTLWTVNTVSGEEKRIVDGGVVPASHAALPYDRSQAKEFSWSPDQRGVVYLSIKSGASNVLISAIDSTQPVSVTKNTDSNVTFYCPTWSSDGRRIAFTSVQKTTGGGAKPITGVWISDQGNTAQIYSTSDNLRFLGWSAVDKLLFESSDSTIKASPQDIKLLEVSTKGNSRIVTSFKDIYALSMTISEDKKSLAFTVRREDKDNICVSSPGGEIRIITANNDPKIFYGSLRWSPDGKNIFFDKQEKITTISMFENFR